MTTLREIVAQFSTMKTPVPEELDNSGIYARRPWSPGSEAIVAACSTEEEDQRAMAQGYDGILDVNSAVEQFEALMDNRSAFDPDEAAWLLIHYSEHDAYPEWLWDPSLYKTLFAGSPHADPELPQERDPSAD